MLQARWRTPLASELRFTTHTNEAIRIAHEASGVFQAPALTWVHFTFQDEPADADGRHDPEDAFIDSETILAQDTITELVGESDDDEDLDSPEQVFDEVHLATAPDDQWTSEGRSSHLTDSRYSR